MSGSEGPGRLEDRAWTLLHEAGGGAEVEDLARILLATSSDAAVRVLTGLLLKDARFRIAGGRIALAEAPTAGPSPGVPLDEIEFAVIDFETTGYGAGDRAIEVGVSCVLGGREIEHFQTLLDPGVPPSPFVVGLTGIRPADLLGQPAFGEVWPRLSGLLKGRVVVAHNLPFDMGVLRRELLRHQGHDRFDHDARLCTLRMARRLIPRGESRGLDALVHRFGFEVAARHRALDDARVTGRLLYRLASLAGERREMRTWGDLQGFLEGGG